MDGIPMQSQKLGNNGGVFLVRLCFSKVELHEVGDQQRIDNQTLKVHARQEGKEV